MIKLFFPLYHELSSQQRGIAKKRTIMKNILIACSFILCITACNSQENKTNLLNSTKNTDSDSSYVRLIELIKQEKYIPIKIIKETNLFADSINMFEDSTIFEGVEVIDIDEIKFIRLTQFNNNYTYTILATFKEKTLIQKKHFIKNCQTCTKDDFFSEIWFPSNDEEYTFRIEYFNPIQETGMIHPSQKQNLKIEYWKIDSSGSFILYKN